MSNDTRVKDVTKLDFQQWKHHPVSKIFFEYLKDKRKFLTDIFMASWLAGSSAPNIEQTMRGQVIELIELEEIQFEAMQAFYEQ